MLLGDVIARFDDEVAATETLMALRDLTLVASVTTAAAREELTLGEFAMRAVDRFVSQASDEDWLTLIGRLTRSSDPGGVFLSHALTLALGAAAPRPAPHVA